MECNRQRRRDDNAASLKTIVGSTFAKFSFERFDFGYNPNIQLYTVDVTSNQIDFPNGLSLYGTK